MVKSGPVPRKFLRGEPNFLRRGPSRRKKFFAIQKPFFLYPLQTFARLRRGPGPHGPPPSVRAWLKDSFFG